MTRSIADPIVRAPVCSRADRIRALRAELAALEAEERAAADRALLVAIALTVRGCVFTARELVAHAALDPMLRAAIGDRRPKQLGVRLRRLTDQPIAGFRLCRVDRDEAGCLWVLHLQPDAGGRTGSGAE